MVRKLGELPNCLVFSSGTESYQNSPILAFTLLLFAYFQFCIYFSEVIILGLVMFS